MMFNLDVYKEIRIPGTSTWLRYRLSLPFAPFIGLELMKGKWSVILKEVCWNKGTFECTAEAMLLHTDARLNPILENFLEEGWEIYEI